MKNTPQTYTVKNVDCHVYLFIACTTVKLQKLSPSALEAGTFTFKVAKKHRIHEKLKGVFCCVN